MHIPWVLMHGTMLNYTPGDHFTTRYRNLKNYSFIRVFSEYKYRLPYYRGYYFHDTPVTMSHDVGSFQVFKNIFKGQNVA